MAMPEQKKQQKDRRKSKKMKRDSRARRASSGGKGVGRHKTICWRDVSERGRECGRWSSSLKVRWPGASSIATYLRGI